MRTNENSRTSQYNGMLVSLSKRMSHHFSVNGSYTWSHAITSGEDFFGLSEPGDPTNMKAERGPAFNDVRHAVNLSGVIDTGRLSQTNILRWFTNDITLGFIEQLQSGRPYPFSTGSGGYADAIFFGAGNETHQRPDVLPDGTISSAGLASADGTNGLFGPGAVAACIAGGNPAAQCTAMQNTFLAPADASGLGTLDVNGDVVDFRKINGNLKRDAGRGSPFYRTDASLKKSFNMPKAENVKLELQVDALNIFNHSNFQGFNANNFLSLLPSSFSPTCTNCMRPNGTYAGKNGQILHLSDITHGKISSDLTNPDFGALGDPASVDGSRLFQVSFHVRF